MQVSSPYLSRPIDQTIKHSYYFLIIMKLFNTSFVAIAVMLTASCSIVRAVGYADYCPSPKPNPPTNSYVCVSTNDGYVDPSITVGTGVNTDVYFDDTDKSFDSK